MQTRTSTSLIILLVLSWIIFVGVCIEAGSFITSTVGTMLWSPDGAKHLWHQADLTSLYYFDRGYFYIETIMICIVAVLRCIIFYLIIMLLHNKKLDLARPFNKELGRFTTQLACLSLLTGFFSLMGAKHAAWFVTKGVKMPDVELLRLGGADVWLFMGVILLVIAHVIKKGIEIQTENELTV